MKIILAILVGATLFLAGCGANQVYDTAAKGIDRYYCVADLELREINRDLFNKSMAKYGNSGVIHCEGDE